MRRLVQVLVGIYIYIYTCSVGNMWTCCSVFILSEASWVPHSRNVEIDITAMGISILNILGEEPIGTPISDI